MITISEAHYKKLVQAIELFHKNLDFLTPNNADIEEVYQSWKLINDQLNTLYKTINRDLENILDKNSSFQNENKELQNQITHIKTQNTDLLKTNTVQRAELAKNQADFNKLKEIAKGLKNSLKEKQRQIQAKNEREIQLEEKVKKYKKLYHQQVKKVQKLDKIVTVLEVAQKNSAKQKELDDQLQYLQEELDQLQNERE